MNDISRTFFKQRILILTVILILAIIGIGIYSPIYTNSKIVKSNITVYLDNDTEEVFKNEFESKKDFYKYYNYEIISDYENADFVFTSDINNIDITQDYTIEGYSPLVVCLKDTTNLNNYLKNKTKEGFLTCAGASKIKNNYNDVISCDFLRIIEAVLNGEDWSDLGGEDKKITIFCPEANTIAGDLFYDFLLITINNGKYPTDNIEEIKEKADTFLSSSNTIQTDVKSKIDKLGGTLQEEDIYVLFESDLISATNGNGEISVTYPETTVIKQLYMQYNNLDLKDKMLEIFEDSTSLSLKLHKYFRNSRYPHFMSNEGIPTYFNVQEGFNYYELSK